MYRGEDAFEIGTHADSIGNRRSSDYANESVRRFTEETTEDGIVQVFYLNSDVFSNFFPMTPGNCTNESFLMFYFLH